MGSLPDEAWRHYLIADVSLIGPELAKGETDGVDEDEQADIPPNAGLNSISNGLRLLRPKLPYDSKNTRGNTLADLVSA
jgi:hypothetical protein